MPKKASKIMTTDNDIAPTPVSVPATQTVAEKIKYEYIHSAISPLQLALKHNVEVEDVLVAIDASDLLEVPIVGDQVDSAGPGVALNRGTTARATYTKN
jgi:hypothetical protein